MVKPKTQKSKAGKSAPAAKRQVPKPGKTQVPAKKGWEWAAFTKKSVTFNRCAANLSELLSQTYGDNVSISQFEKMVSALASMKPEQKELIYLSKGTLDCYEDYRTARDARDTERKNFRDDISVVDVEGGLKVATEIAREETLESDMEDGDSN